MTLTRAPKRIQLHRTKGWRKPEGAIVVARPSRWGNPFKAHHEYGAVHAVYATGALVQQTPSRADAVALAVALYRNLLTGWNPTTLPRTAGFTAAYFAHTRWVARFDRHPVDVARLILAGHDLACWCPLEDGAGSVPCHADVLLELANPTETRIA